MNFPVPYGDVKKATELTRAAPVSGAPVSGRALNAPRASQRRAVRGAPQPQSAPVAAPVPVVPASPQPLVEVARLWMAAAELPDASPLVREYAARAAREAGLG